MTESTPNPSFASKAVSVLSTSTQLVGKNPGANRTVLVYNNDAETVFVGQKGVSTTNGFPIAAGGAFGFDTGAALYGIAATGPVNCRVLEVIP